MSSSLPTGVLYCDDNLPRLQELPSGSVDLIYLDPPFFSNRVYEVIWGDEAEIRSFDDRWEGGMQHYIGWMRDRLTEMHRVLKATGTLYLHCDPHASHYLKVMLDDVFGSTARFISEVVWKRTSAHNRVTRFGPVHDLILVYGKSTRWTWNPVYVPYDEDYVESNFRRRDSSGRRFSTADLTSNNPGARFEWQGRLPPGDRYWGVSLDTMKQHEANDRLYYTRNGLPRLKNYFDQMPGQLVQDVWTDIRPLHANAREREGWPTQKPEPLLERILAASSNPGDIVLDPFCGCGTTLAVAERLNRQWVGIDISLTAIDIMERRLMKLGRRPIIVNAPTTIDALKRLKPFEFQNWAISAINGTHSPRRSGDMGIDGHWFFTRDPVQVKQSEHVGRNVVDNFETAVRRAGYDTGYVIAFSFTRDAVDEVARARSDGLTIHLVKAAAVLLMRRRLFGSFHDLPGPMPQTVEELPLPPVRKPSEMPSFEELRESERRSA